MLPTLVKNWWLLVLCGVFEAAASAVHFLLRDPDGSPTLHRFGVGG